MRGFLKLVMLMGLAGMLLVGAVSAEEEVRPRDPAIEGVIRQQMDAFLADDVESAFEFAAPNIQSMFRTPKIFGDMVRNGYPMVWKPSGVQFGDLRMIDGALWQEVYVMDGRGRSFALDYRMLEVDGAWRISGVQFLQTPDVSA